MKLAFISDIHGNAIALKAVLDDIATKKVDEIFVLGDLCYRGPEPRKSLQMVQSLGCNVIKGNADEWVVRGIRKGEVPDQAIEMMTQERKWTFSQIEESDIRYIQNLRLELTKEVEGLRFHVFHATPESLFEIVTPTVGDSILSEKLMVKEADVYIYGHIHHPYIRFINGKSLINTGSVGLPFDGINKASYALVELDDGNFQTSIVRVGYDVQRVIEQFKESDYPNVEFMVNVLRNASL